MRQNHGSDTSALIITRKDDRYPFRATEVDSISILLWKITYLTIIVCNFHKRRWSSENYEVFFGNKRPRRFIPMLHMREFPISRFMTEGVAAVG